MNKLSIGELQGALRASVAIELVEILGYTKSDAARVMHLTPSALSQYLNRKRGGKASSEFNGSKLFQKHVKVLANALSRNFRQNASIDPSRKFLEVTDKLVQDLSLNAKSSTQKDLLSKKDMGHWLKALRARLDEEQNAATSCMKFAQTSSDDLTRTLFRQIASDSLRHADIVSLLMSNVDRSEPFFGSKPPQISQIEEMIRSEENAGDANIAHLRNKLGPSAALLIDSIEADERKHLLLLKGLKTLLTDFEKHKQ